MFLYGFILFLVLFLIYIIFALKNAPYGCEDEDGFHFLKDDGDVTRVSDKKAAA